MKTRDEELRGLYMSLVLALALYDIEQSDVELLLQLADDDKEPAQATRILDTLALVAARSTPPGYFPSRVGSSF